MLPSLAALVLAFLLLGAALRDLATRTLPDGLALMVAGIGLALRGAEGWMALLLSLGTALALFLALVPFAGRGWLGGGDVKLAAAFTLALPPAATGDFLLASSLAGGLLGLLYLVARGRLPRLSRARVPALLAIEARRLRRGGPIPYAVALAAGGLHTLFGVG